MATRNENRPSSQADAEERTCARLQDVDRNKESLLHHFALGLGLRGCKISRGNKLRRKDYHHGSDEYNAIRAEIVQFIYIIYFLLGFLGAPVITALGFFRANSPWPWFSVALLFYITIVGCWIASVNSRIALCSAYLRVFHGYRAGWEFLQDCSLGILASWGSKIAVFFMYVLLVVVSVAYPCILTPDPVTVNPALVAVRVGPVSLTLDPVSAKPDPVRTSGVGEVVLWIMVFVSLLAPCMFIRSWNPKGMEKTVRKHFRRDKIPKGHAPASERAPEAEPAGSHAP